MAYVPIVTGDDVAQALGLPSTPAALDGVAETADALISPFLAPTVDRTGPVPSPVTEAGIVLAVDIWQNRTAAGGQNVGIDGTPGPYRMGRSLLDRVTGLLGPWLATESEVG